MGCSKELIVLFSAILPKYSHIIALAWRGEIFDIVPDGQ